MDDHNHEEVSYLTHVKLPYHLKYDELKLDPSSENGATVAAFLDRYWDLELSEEELKRIIVSAALLLNTGRNYTVGQCLDTAVVWERG